MPVSHTGPTWFDRRWSIPELVQRKQGRRVSVVLPALDEEATVAGVIASIRPLVGGLVDELLLIDSGSTDGTIAAARAAGATVHTREQAFPQLPPRAGKGEVLWRSLAVAQGDLIVFVDSDLISPSPMFVPSLLAPLLFDDALHLVKGFYRRPLRTEGRTDADGGGRVTQLVARPLLSALAPELAEIVQPLGGEYAATRELLTAIPFAPGYGVEIGILLDCFARHGIAAIGQVDLGTRLHRNRPNDELAAMSRQIIATMLDRLGLEDSGRGLPQFIPHGTGWRRTVTEPSFADRPPMSLTIDPPGADAGEWAALDSRLGIA
ncbi:glucosyl-3-phosphoglycerate synthase [Nocardia macrotermitis]|uniref:Glucosyl-3-phosphoglycerate synthase n=1 Tax=Nocardia macrotermitis TaxID=2585198 RepID=A0A7K0CUF7_9NOCA|nr:glucosyl-3-phosphoglycerate synthase [Nocardia macrotermitis]MQY17117.1 Glucosyl-3-phosphoglycerate synthase [Nocardia macrotermitis]